MKKNLTIGVTVLALLAVLAGGALLYASQGTATPKPATTANQEENVQENVQDPSYIGSISVPESTSDQALAGMAKITASDAEAAALAQFPEAAVLSTQIESENGYLVYSVELQTASGIKSVKVDAGDAQILYTGSGGGVETPEHDAPETGENEPAGGEESDSE